MNKFKVRRKTIFCASCRQTYLARKVITARPLVDDISELGFECTACHKWNRLYFETPEITNARNKLATQVLTASPPQVLNLRRSFTSLFVAEQARVKKLQEDGKLRPVISSFVPEGVIA